MGTPSFFQIGGDQPETGHRQLKFSSWVHGMTNWLKSGHCLPKTPPLSRAAGSGQVMLDINGALKAIGYGLLVLFFAVGVVKTCGSFTDVKRPEHALKLFIRFALAKAAVTYGLDLMLAVFKIVQGIFPPLLPNRVCQEAAAPHSRRKSSIKSIT